MYFEEMLELLGRKLVVGLLLAGFILPFVFPIPVLRLAYLQTLCGIFLFIAFFHRFSNLFSSKTLLGRALSYIGQYTLEIYLLHYFVIRWLVRYNIVESQPWFAENPVLQFIVCMSVSLGIIAIVLSFATLLRTSWGRPLYRLVFGKVNTATFSKT